MTKGPFRLNALSFIDHKSNFRIETLNKFFEQVGIAGIATKIKDTTAFKEYSGQEFVNKRIEQLKNEVLFEDLDDLVWRRNVVAHGWPDETLSIDMMKERANFIRLIGQCIFEVLWQSILFHIVRHQSCHLPKPLKVYKNSIVCIHLEKGELKQGARIIARSAEKHYFDGKIVSIEVDHVRKTEIIAPPAVDVAFSVDFKAKENFIYHIVL